MKKKDLELEIFSRHLILKEFNEKNFNVLQKQIIRNYLIGLCAYIKDLKFKLFFKKQSIKL